MKLVLANNQSAEFVQFHASVQANEPLYEYAGYTSLLFSFNGISCTFINLDSGMSASEYDGVYLNGYLKTPEIAFTAATILDSCNVPYVNSELRNAPSLTKLSSYAKLAAKGVPLPKTYAGTAATLTRAAESGYLADVSYPCILKRADADRGIDNFILHDWAAVNKKITTGDFDSIWLLQEFIPNDGYYVVTYYHDKLEFGVYRAHVERADRDETKRHMFKPKGGANASFMKAEEVPANVAEVSRAATRAMNREVASVDVVCHRETGQSYVLEVNYNPQLVTVSVFRDERIESFIRGIRDIE